MCGSPQPLAPLQYMPPSHSPLLLLKNKKKNSEWAAVTLEEFWWCRPSLWIVDCVWEGSKCSCADMLFVEKGASPFTHFFPFTIDRKYRSLQWSGFLKCILFPLQLLCVHAGRRCHAAVTALNDHVGPDNDYPCHCAANTSGTECGAPQKKNIAPLLILLLNTR